MRSFSDKDSQLWSWISLALCVGMLSSCASAYSKPKAAPVTTPLLSSQSGGLSQKNSLRLSQFIILEDFNHGEIKNSETIYWRSAQPQKISFVIDKDSRRAEAGYSLKSHYQLAKRETATFQHRFIRLDISQAKTLVLIARHHPKAKSSVQIVLRLGDQLEKTAEYDLTEVLRNQQGWKEINIPLNAFQGMDLNRLATFTLELHNKGHAEEGDLWLDEIAFYGPENAGFESLRDNYFGFPQMVYDSKRKTELWATLDDKKFLREIAKDTWRYFENATERNTHLISDHIRLGEAPLIGSYTSPTNIAMDMLATLSASDLGFVTQSQALRRLQLIFKTLSKMPRFKNFFYNYYDITSLEPTREFVSSVDSGWLAIAMVVVRQAFPNELGGEATKFLNEFNFDEFYDTGTNQLSLGIDTKTGQLVENHYGLLATEARATSLLAIGKGDISREHWWFMFRTPPAAWKWQNQIPQGREVEQEGVAYFQGYYSHQNKKFIPSWGGSLFEFLMPTLILKEKELAPQGMGLNNKIATELHRDYALLEKEYPVWGISPSAIGNGKQWRYEEFGVNMLGAKGYPDAGVITPHVSFLALDSLPEDAKDNIRKLLDFDLYGPYGFFDTVDLKSKKANPQYLALDQGMILAAICNYLKEGSLKERFHQDTAVKRAEDLLVKESFFNP